MSDEANSARVEPSEVPGALEVVASSNSITAQLSEFDGARLRARRMEQDFSDTMRVPAAGDHTLVYFIQGKSAVERLYDSRIDASTDKLRSTTLHPAGITSGWRCPDPIEVLHLYIEDETLRLFAEQDLDVDPSKIEMIDRMGVLDPFVQGLAPLIMHEMASPYRSSQLMLDSLDMVVAGHVLRAYTNLGDRGHAALNETSRTLPHNAIGLIQSFIADNLDGKVTLDDLAELVQMSPFQFTRAFKATVGETPHRYLIQLRLQRARDLLSNTKLTLADIAYACGFSSQAHMTSTFTKHLGISPGRYRREVRT